MSEQGTPRAARPGTTRFKGKQGSKHKTGRMKVSRGSRSESQGDSGTRSRPSAVSTKGLSLRLKIIIAMAGVVIVTAVITFIVVSNKAISQLETEINSKGDRMVAILASMGDEYWYTAIHSLKNQRKLWFHKIVDEVSAKGDWNQRLRMADNQREYLRAIQPFGTARGEAFDQLVADLSQNEAWKDGVLANPGLKRMYENLVRPLPELEKIKPLLKLKGETSSDLFLAGVVDAQNGHKGALPGVSMGEQTEVNLAIDPGTSTVTRRDKPIRVNGVPIRTRWFIREPDSGATRQLRYFVALKLESIDSAKSQLNTAILLPILLTGILGIGIAIWISALITNPLQSLMGDIQAVAAGDFDHQTHPRSKDEIGQLAVTFNRMTQALRVAREQEMEAKALEHELGIANEIQANLLPKKMLRLPNYDVGAYYRPSKEVGGDYYDFIQIDEHNIGIIVADVSGKGVPGSLVMSMARAFVRMEAERSRNVSPSDTLIRANRMLAQDIKKGMFVTALYAILNVKTRQLSVASAGHNPMILWRAKENKIHLVNPAGIALGFDKGPVFERTIKEEKIVLYPNDRIVTYTDGTVEAMNEENEEFGDDKFYALVQKLATKESNELINLLVRALDDHAGDAPQHDDMTLVTVRVTG